MAKSSKDKKQQKRKAKQKQVRSDRQRSATRDRGDQLAYKASHYWETGNLDKAVETVKKASKLRPGDPEVLRLMGNIARESGRGTLELEALAGLEECGQIQDSERLTRLGILFKMDRHQECLEYAEHLLKILSDLKIRSKVKIRKDIREIKAYCRQELEKERLRKRSKAVLDSGVAVAQAAKAAIRKKKTAEKQHPDKKKSPAPPKETAKKSVCEPEKRLPEIPLAFDLDEDSFFDLFSNPASSGPALYDLALESHAIRFKESFESLVCLSSLSQVRSYWYQEETAKKVLKRFRGRALLSDEVGLGKTIEALIIFSEYVKRGMVKTGLILTPTPLVSQWKDEMKSKFGLDIPSTDDPDFKKKGNRFWEAPFILASINQAKSKKNFDLVTAREYDMVIVDEAHHLKNRTTLNWKLVNAIQKRFILLLTATPVENNLMELYNLITLLKPGQLETATAFREKFMKRGDPTNPRNRAQLKELLQEVMIRNTRALAGINIPPRYASTIRIEPSKHELEFYARLETLVMELNTSTRGRGRLVSKNILAQAGSCPGAVEGAISRMLEKKEYLADHGQALKEVKELCRTGPDTPKNRALLKLIRSSREKMIVFVKYRATLDHISAFLEKHGISTALFHGQMDNRKKDLAIEAFRNETKVLVTTEIGGEGRNLQFCCQMVNYDLPWNPMKIEQRIGRIHRIGQEKEVHIFNLCAAGSIEDHILDILDRKINMFEMVVGEIDMILGRVRDEKEFEDLVYDIWVDSGSDQDRHKGFDNLGTRLKRARTGYEKTRELDEKLFGDSYEL